MDINKLIIPIVSQGIQWVNEKMKPSKKELELKISELEKQVETLVCDNVFLQKKINEIVYAILTQLESRGNYVINADSIIQIDGNYDTVQIMKESVPVPMQTNIENISSIFDDMDEEILRRKLLRPSERGEEQW